MQKKPDTTPKNQSDSPAVKQFSASSGLVILHDKKSIIFDGTLGLTPPIHFNLLKGGLDDYFNTRKTTDSQPGLNRQTEQVQNTDQEAPLPESANTTPIPPITSKEIPKETSKAASTSEPSDQPLVSIKAEKQEKDDGDVNWWLIGGILIGSVTIGGVILYFLLKTDEADTQTQSLNIEGIKTNTLSGKVDIGTLIADHGLKVAVYSPDNRLITESDVDANGKYSASIPDYLPYVKLKVFDKDAEADYLDEYTKSNKDLDFQLISIVPLSNGSSQDVAHINPLTTLASWLMGINTEGEGFISDSTNITLANRAIALYFLGNYAIDLTGYNIQTLLDADGNLLNTNEGGYFLTLLSALEHQKQFSKLDALRLLLEHFSKNPSGIFANNELYQSLEDLPAQIATQYDTSLQAKLDAYLGNLMVNSQQHDGFLLGNRIEIKEDATHTFTLDDFLFLSEDIHQGFTEITIKNLPQKGYLRYEGVDITEGNFSVTKENLNKLTFKGRSNESGQDYFEFNFTYLLDGTNSSTQSLIFHIEEVNDSPKLVINPLLTELTSKGFKIHKSLSNDQSNILLINLKDDEFLGIWVDKNYLFKSVIYSNDQVFALDKISDENTLHSLGDSSIKITEAYSSVDDKQQVVLAFNQADADDNILASILFLDEKQAIKTTQRLNQGHTIEDIISLSNNTKAVVHINTLSNEGFVSLYAENGNFTKQVTLDSLNLTENSQLSLSALSNGGFALSSTTNNKLTIHEFNQQGDRLQTIEEISGVSIKSDQSPMMIDQASGALTILYATDTGIYLEGFGASQITNQAIAESNQGLTLGRYHLLETHDGFFITWVEAQDASTQIKGKYFNQAGEALTTEIIIHDTLSTNEITQISVIQLPNQQLQLAWTEDKNGQEDSFLSTINTQWLQHNLQDNLTVLDVSATDVETSIASIELMDDAGGFFALDTSSNEISITDYTKIVVSDSALFNLKIRATDDTGVTQTVDYAFQFPGSVKVQSESNKNQVTFNIDTSSIENIDDLTVAELRGLGLLSGPIEVLNTTQLYDYSLSSHPNYPDLPFA
ncbi:MAG: hypothetical protein OXE99_10270 [Cellvibrionales bacterium]|nr:hypothetical protein [Cellvibrionales bacterium]